MRKRREFIAGLGAAAAVWPLAARAQQPAMPVIGVMSPLTVATAARNLAALRQGLRDLGYSEGRNIKIDYRFADGTPERYPALIAELIALKPVRDRRRVDARGCGREQGDANDTLGLGRRR